jgi:hypothetical protein
MTDRDKPHTPKPSGARHTDLIPPPATVSSVRTGGAPHPAPGITPDTEIGRVFCTPVLSASEQVTRILQGGDVPPDTPRPAAPGTRLPEDYKIPPGAITAEPDPTLVLTAERIRAEAVIRADDIPNRHLPMGRAEQFYRNNPHLRPSGQSNALGSYRENPHLRPSPSEPAQQPAPAMRPGKAMKPGKALKSRATPPKAPDFMLSTLTRNGRPVTIYAQNSGTLYGRIDKVAWSWEAATGRSLLRKGTKEMEDFDGGQDSDRYDLIPPNKDPSHYVVDSMVYAYGTGDLLSESYGHKVADVRVVGRFPRHDGVQHVRAYILSDSERDRIWGLLYGDSPDYTDRCVLQTLGAAQDVDHGA